MSKLALPLAALCFCTWAVSLAGVASLQQACEPGWSDNLVAINGFSAGLPCYKTFRFYWFIVCIEVFLIFGLAGAAATGFLAKSKTAWIGLFSVATLLYIQMSDTFLSAEDTLKSLDAYGRARTMTAGSIMTATVNCFIIIALGIADGEAAAPAKEASQV